MTGALSERIASSPDAEVSSNDFDADQILYVLPPIGMQTQDC